MKHLWIFCLFAILPILALPARYNVIPQVRAEVSSTGNLEAPASTLQDSQVKQYIEAQAKALGINPAVADWIVGHESQYGQNLVGDDGQSLGYWMISLTYHPEVAPQCSMSLKCSTNWALHWIKAGHIQQWSTWKFRYLWYRGQTPPTQIFL